jgi:hypothetical protein
MAKLFKAISVLTFLLVLGVLVFAQTASKKGGAKAPAKTEQPASPKPSGH